MSDTLSVIFLAVAVAISINFGIMSKMETNTEDPQITFSDSDGSLFPEAVEQTWCDTAKHKTEETGILEQQKIEPDEGTKGSLQKIGYNAALILIPCTIFFLVYKGWIYLKKLNSQTFDDDPVAQDDGKVAHQSWNFTPSYMTESEPDLVQEPDDEITQTNGQLEFINTCLHGSFEKEMWGEVNDKKYDQERLLPLQPQYELNQVESSIVESYPEVFYRRFVTLRVQGVNLPIEEDAATLDTIHITKLLDSRKNKPAHLANSFLECSFLYQTLFDMILELNAEQLESNNNFCSTLITAQNFHEFRDNLEAQFVNIVRAAFPLLGAAQLGFDIKANDPNRRVFSFHIERLIGFSEWAIHEPNDSSEIFPGACQTKPFLLLNESPDFVYYLVDLEINSNISVHKSKGLLDQEGFPVEKALKILRNERHGSTKLPVAVNLKYGTEGTVHLTTLAIHYAYQDKRLARTLIEDGLKHVFKNSETKPRFLTFWVAVPDEAAIRCYAKLGAIALLHRSNHYHYGVVAGYDEQYLEGRVMTVPSLLLVIGLDHDESGGVKLVPLVDGAHSDYIKWERA